MEPLVKTKYFTLNAGVRCARKLTQELSKSKGVDYGIDEAINYYFFEQPNNINRWCEAILISINAHRESVNQPPMEEKEFMDIIDKLGFKILGEIIVKLTKTFIAIHSQEELSSEKKSIFSPKTSSLNLPGK